MQWEPMALIELCHPIGIKETLKVFLRHYLQLKETSADPVLGEARGKRKASTCPKHESGSQHPQERILSCELDCEDMYFLSPP